MIISEEPVAMNNIKFFNWDWTSKGTKDAIQRLEQESKSKTK